MIDRALSARPARRRLVAAAAALGALALSSGILPVQAQQAAWPARPVRLVVTFPPGGSSDAAARIVAPKLAERLGQPVVVDNKPGAGGGVGLELVAKAPPDGYTIVLAAAGGLTANPSLYKSLAYDPVRDFAPVTSFGTSPFVLIANPSLPARNVGEVIAMARQQPAKLSYASGGNGTAMHLSGELVKSMGGVHILHIPYRGSGPAMLSVMSGETQLAVVDLATVAGQLQSNRLKVLGVMDRQRSQLAPEFPTLAESGLKDFDAAGWFAILAPAATPPAVVAKLNTEITTILRQPDVRERFAAAGLEPLPSTSEELAQRIRAETTKWAQVIKVSGAKLD